MNWKLAPLVPSDAQEALELLKTLSDQGEVLYKPIEEEDFLGRFFGEKAGEGFFRFNLATPRRNVQAALENIEKMVRSICK